MATAPHGARGCSRRRPVSCQPFLPRAGALRARHDIWDAVYVNLSLPLGVGRRGGPEAPPPLPFGTGSIPDPAPPPARFLRVQAKVKAKRDKAKLAKVQEEAFTEAMAGR